MLSTGYFAGLLLEPFLFFERSRRSQRSSNVSAVARSERPCKCGHAREVHKKGLYECTECESFVCDLYRRDPRKHAYWDEPGYDGEVGRADVELDVVSQMNRARARARRHSR